MLRETLTNLSKTGQNGEESKHFIDLLTLSLHLLLLCCLNPLPSSWQCFPCNSVALVIYYKSFSMGCVIELQYLEV